MPPLHLFPPFNALLNAACGVLLFTGYVFVRQGRLLAHRRCMLAACSVSALFLCSYLFYHYHAGATRFAGTGWARPVYFSILISHTILATAIVPLAIVTVILGLRGRFPQHRRIARWTFPLWMYVSVTGVIVYFFLYHLFPSR